ncbi:hypothetical protein [Streptomyces sp. NPDC053755]|uniref:hypothetical protein n=1 Tax=Streptomyces sp. NPDC053755 TaxID=3155815 RepID=UPI00342113C1
MLRAVAGTPYRRIVHNTDRLLTVGGGIPVWLLTVCGVLAAGIATTVAVRVRRRGTGVRSTV